MLSSNRNIKLWNDIDFMMEWFEEPRFPRRILTGVTKEARTVKDRLDIMSYIEGAQRKDCYLNAYINYDAIADLSHLTPIPKPKPVPNHFMIDIDRKHFSSDEELEQALAGTLQNIKRNVTGISGAYFIVIASGSGGYHVHVPLPGLQTPLQEMSEFEAFKDDPEINDKFLKFAERRLSNNKADHHHNPSINSCLFRIPGTINTKARAAGVKDPTVRVVQGFEYANKRIGQRYGLPNFARETCESRPTTKFLNDFYAYLIQEQINDKIIQSDKRLRSLTLGKCLPRARNNTIWWIDKLLATSVDDGRKDLLFWVLTPYLISVRRLDYDQACTILETWLSKCHEVRRLEPSPSYFENRIRYCLKTAEKEGWKPLRFSTFKEYYPDLFRELFGGK